MTTDRDMDRARETLDATYDELPLFTRAVTKAQETAAANIIAAALAAERAPLEARIAELDDALEKRGAEVERLRAELAYARRAAITPDPLLAAAEERGARWGIEAAAKVAYQAARGNVERIDADSPERDVVRAMLSGAVHEAIVSLGAGDVVRAAREREGAEAESEPPVERGDLLTPEKVRELLAEGRECRREFERQRDQAESTARKRAEPLTRADLDAFRGELVRALREVTSLQPFLRLADKLETGR